MASTLRMGQDGRALPGTAANDGEGTTLAFAPPRARRCPTCSQAFSGEARFCPFDGDPLVDAPDWNPAADALIGATIDGRYEVVSVLGEGGMGTVYEVRHTSLDRRFAMKVLRRDVAEDADVSERFAREARAAASIGHPNIVAVNDFGELPEAPRAGRRRRLPYFVMELLHGTTLGAVLKREGRLSPARAASIAVQCASALEAAHRAGVLHRDLKPDNVFLVQTGGRDVVKLLDFGVAKIAGLGRLTRAGRVFGTPCYMSPEQAAGKEVDDRADIYALGVILYECLGGRVPFEADTYMGVLTKHLFAKPAPIDRVLEGGSDLGGLDDIVMRCLEKVPENRYQTMAELVAALEGALAETQLAARPVPDARRSERSRKPLPEPVIEEAELPLVRLRPPLGSLRTWGLVAAGAALFAGSVALGFRSGDRPPEPAPAPAPAESAAAPAMPSAALPAAAAAPSEAPPSEPPAASASPPAPAASSRAPAGASRPVREKTPVKPPARTAPTSGADKPPRATEVVDPWK